MLGAAREESLDHPPGVFTSISMGLGYGCGVRPDGRVECWGNDAKGKQMLQTCGSDP